MLFKNYEYFLMIADCGSLTKAADKLYISQPSLSKYLSRLEKTLEIELFNRKSSPLKLTYAGELYYEYIQEVAELEKQLNNEFKKIRNDGRERVCLGIGPWRGTCILPVVLPVLAEKYPFIDVSVLEGESNFLENAILKNKVDFCIMSLPVDYAKLAYEIFLKEKILLVGNNSHPLVKEAKKEKSTGCVYSHFDITRLKNQRLYLTTPGQNFAFLIHSLFSKVNFRPVNICEIQNLTTAFNLVVKGLGFSFLPESGLKTTLIPENITLFTVGEPELSWSFAAVYKKTAHIPKSVRLIIDTLKEIYSPAQLQ